MNRRNLLTAIASLVTLPMVKRKVEAIPPIGSPMPRDVTYRILSANECRELLSDKISASVDVPAVGCTFFYRSNAGLPE